MIANAISRAIGVGTPGPTDNFWYTPVGSMSSSGVQVTDSVALSISTVFACIRVLSDAMGVLPCFVYQETDESKRKAPEHPFYYPLHSAPNVFQTPIEWKAMAVAHLGLRGNFYAQILPPSMDHEHIQLVPRHPDRIKVAQLPSGRLRYEWHREDGTTKTLTDANVLHIKLNSLGADGSLGSSPIAYARDSIGVTKSRHGLLASMYKGGGFFKYFLKTDKILGAEGRRNFREGWRDVHSQGTYSPPILEEGMDLKTLGMSAEDMQTVESEEIGAVEICQYFGVPPHMVHLLKRATYSNIEQQGIEFKTLHLQPWATRFEQGVRRHFENPDDYYAEFLMDALMRGDTASRYEAYTKGLGGRPFLTLNEVRQKENLDPVNGGDEIAEPLNMQVPGEAGKQNRDQPEEMDTDEHDDEETQTAAVNLVPIIRDTANRIVVRELKALKPKWAACGGDKHKWETSSRAWFVKHGQYVADAIQPIIDASGAESWACAVFVQRYLKESEADLSNPVEAFEQWGNTKAATLAEQIEEELRCTTES